MSSELTNCLLGQLSMLDCMHFKTFGYLYKFVLKMSSQRNNNSKTLNGGKNQLFPFLVKKNFKSIKIALILIISIYLFITPPPPKLFTLDIHNLCKGIDSKGVIL